jgi:thiol-disulfide isomerase/thioredoxin
MKLRKPKLKDLIFLSIIALLIIPQTRKPIQVLLHQGFAKFGPSIVEEANRKSISFAEWERKDLDGKSLNFKDLENKVIFLNFWATWCPPCIAELPSIQDLYSDYKGKIAFVLISSEKLQVVKSFKNKKGYKLNSYLPLSAYPNDFNIRSIPRTFLISKTAEVVIDKSGAANWNSNSVRKQIDALILQ